MLINNSESREVGGKGGSELSDPKIVTVSILVPLSPFSHLPVPFGFNFYYDRLLVSHFLFPPRATLCAHQSRLLLCSLYLDLESITWFTGSSAAW